jgi:DNA repair protein RecN (Recombination protein N)
MLKSFEVKDYALIEHIFVEFNSGLNIITGETGAGKSILVDAMGLLLGERASTEVVRKDANKAVVEGIFNVEGNKKIRLLLEKNNLEVLPELIVRREVSLKGSNRCFLNDSPVPLLQIKEAGDLLVDLHGQHEHQSLLKTETHIDYLDEFGNYDDLLMKYRKVYNELLSAEKELRELKQREEILKEKKEICAFQVKEIDDVSPKANEDEKLLNELKILENSEKLAELTNEIYNLLYDSDNSVHDSIVKVKNDLQELVDIDKSFFETTNEAETILVLVSDISSFVRSYKEKVELEPEEIEGIRERLGAINLLKKKYGGTIDSILEHRKKIGDEYNLAENFSEKIDQLKRKVVDLTKKAIKEATTISSKRKDVSEKVKIGIESSLKDLGISHPTFITQIVTDHSSNGSNEQQKLTKNGMDKVEFFISTNPGENTKPLASVASGGEISRIMLSLKSTLAKSDKLPLLIFDEIDVGISGRIAQKVGDALKKLSEYHQLISITHLPQIAAVADHHFSIQKISKDSRVISAIQKLDISERITEIACLISGETVTETSLKSARELIGLKE